MATTMFIRHKVSDYAQWRSVYDSLDGARSAEFGVVDASVHRDINDQQIIVVTHRFRDAASALAFANSDTLRGAMSGAGVISAPEVWFADDVA